MMTRSKPSLFARHDTFFGVCEALGQDFGFNANWLRLVIAAGLLAAPIVTVAIYLGLGLVILASRLIFPSPATTVEQAPVAVVELQSDNDCDQPDFAKAA